jgi:hypothetical protein
MEEKRHRYPKLGRWNVSGQITFLQGEQERFWYP